jgi:flagellar biosynthesis regulator FlaF
MEFAPVSAYPEHMKVDAIDARVNEWEKLINDLRNNDQVLPEEKKDMLSNALKILNGLKEEKESFLEWQRRKEGYEVNNLEEYFAQ